MLTVIVQIGNTDNKLTQQEWAAFCTATRRAILTHPGGEFDAQIHFAGTSPGDAPWQNAAWVCETKDESTLDTLCADLREVRSVYGQESVAVTYGVTRFV